MPPGVKPSEASAPKPTQRLYGWRKKAVRVESLIVLAFVLALVLLGFELYDRFTASLTLHGAAATFASALRDVQSDARDRNSFLRVNMRPAAPGHACMYVVLDGTEVIATESFPPGVAVTGAVIIDPHGIPREPAQFKFSKHDSEVRVLVDERGVVSIP